MRAVESLEEATARHNRAFQAVQQKLRAFVIFQPHVLQPFSLRQGITNVIAANAALARLLIEKGVFTQAEYVMAMADEMEAEVARWDQRIGSIKGPEVPPK